MINEPTAAAIAYGLDNRSDLIGKINVLVFDLGGGTFDISLMTIEEGGIFEVKAVAGDTHLGGGDFDNRMVDYCAQEFKRKCKKDLTGNQRALGRLRVACEKAKRILSCTSQTSIELDGLHEGIDFSIKLTQAKFVDLNLSLFNSCIKTLEECLKDAKLEKSWVEKIILVGGSTRIPMIQNMLQEFFYDKQLCKSVSPDEAVAYGAAVMAANLSGNNDRSVRDLVLTDVTPLSLGVELVGDVYSVVIPRNTIIPKKNSKVYVTIEDNQSSIYFRVFQGERARSIDNHLLGTLSISGIPLAPKGDQKFEVCFEIDADGILTATIKMLSTGKTEKITITNEIRRLSKEDIEKMVKDAETYKFEDQEFKKRADAYNALEDCIYKMKNKIKEHNINKILHPKSWKKMETAIADMTKWLQDNDAAPIEKLQSKKVYLESICKPMF